jgi:hypothetical protein
LSNHPWIVAHCGSVARDIDRKMSLPGGYPTDSPKKKPLHWEGLPIAALEALGAPTAYCHYLQDAGV